MNKETTDLQYNGGASSYPGYPPNPPQNPPPNPPQTKTSLGVFNGKLAVISDNDKWISIQQLQTYPEYTGNLYENQKEILNYFWHKTMDQWIFEKELSDVFKILKVENDNVVVLKNLEEINKNNILNDSDIIFQKKKEFIGANIFTKSELKHILKKLIIRGIPWYDLEKKWPYTVKHLVTKYITSQVRSLINL